ncbi:DUF1016 domain-containing protein [Candidatus Dependentiae bacterium]|nr:DUF1016 domain-containing protein [Candidatus Dependentiae bacterium]
MPKSKKNTSVSTVAKDYAQMLADIKLHIEIAQRKAMLSVNKELTMLYWSIGKIISQKKDNKEWRANNIETLAKDLQNEFPGIAGFSRTNIFRMKAFFLAYSQNPTAVGQLDELPLFHIPWGHNALLLERVKDINQRLWYAEKVLENGWSRSMLQIRIESNLYTRQGKAITNFKKTLPIPHSDLSQQTLKDPYLFDFLTLRENHVERDVEQGLIDHIQKFLLELGEGFAFVGRQYHLEVDNADYYLDLLFYHLKLRCYIVVELKNTEFVPEYAGKLNFYLSAVDDKVRHPADNPTIGLLLCKTKSNLTVEYALRDINKPIGVAYYQTQLIESLPKQLKGSLPTIEEIEAELQKQEMLSKKKNLRNIQNKKALF